MPRTKPTSRTTAANRRKKAAHGGVKQNKYSYDDTVDAMIRDGVTDVKNMQNWEKMLDGREKLEAKYVREIFKRYHEKLSK